MPVMKQSEKGDEGSDCSSESDEKLTMSNNGVLTSKRVEPDTHTHTAAPSRLRIRPER